MFLKRFILVKEVLPDNEQVVDIVMSINKNLVIRPNILYSNKLFYDTLLNPGENKHYYHYNKVYVLDLNSDYEIIWWYPSANIKRKYTVHHRDIGYQNDIL